MPDRPVQDIGADGAKHERVHVGNGLNRRRAGVMLEGRQPRDVRERGEEVGCEKRSASAGSGPERPPELGSQHEDRRIMGVDRRAGGGRV